MYKITLGVEGMMCGHCEAHVCDAIRNSFKVKKVSASHTDGKVEIISEESIDKGQALMALKPTGYKLTSFAIEPYEQKKGLFGFMK